MEPQKRLESSAICQWVFLRAHQLTPYSEVTCTFKDVTIALGLDEKGEIARAIITPRQKDIP